MINEGMTIRRQHSLQRTVSMSLTSSRIFHASPLADAQTHSNKEIRSLSDPYLNKHLERTGPWSLVDRYLRLHGPDFKD